MLRGKSHYGEFAEKESIATNVLADRLAALVKVGLIERIPDPDDGRKYSYRPLPPAIELLPVITDIAAWGAKYTAVRVPAELQALTDPATRGEFVENLSQQLSAEIEQPALE